MESLRVEDRVKTLAYQPNIDLLRSQNCFALNYQWPSQITLPSMTMSLSPDVDIQQLRKSAPSGCFVVLVGGKFVKRMDAIVRMVDYITSQLAIKLVTYFAEKTEVMPVVDLDFSYKTYSDAFTYCKVFIEKQNNIFGIVFYLFCPVNLTIFYESLILFQNGSMKDSLNFKSICPLKQKEQHTRISYENGFTILVDKYTGDLQMEEYWSRSIKTHLLMVGTVSDICSYWELYKLLFINLNINPIWIKVNIRSDVENYDKVSLSITLTF